MTIAPRWIRLQALTGLAFATFLALHLVNAMTASLGPEAYDGFQRAARRFYQHPLVEVLAIGVAGGMHVAIGAGRALARRRARRAAHSAGAPMPRAPGWLRMHRACGWFLVLVIGGHFLATRGPGLWLDTPADFSYLTFSLTHWPWLMAPYYLLLFSCGAFHLLHGVPVAANVLGWRVPTPSNSRPFASRSITSAVGWSSIQC